MTGDFEFVRLVDGKRKVTSKLADVMPQWKEGNERLLCISAHDDDCPIGGGLAIAAFAAAGAEIFFAIASDGSMGYCSMAEKGNITKIRYAETMNSFKVFGVPEANVNWLGFPDCQLPNFRGRRAARPDDPKAAQLAGFIGLQNSLTEVLRRVKPTRILVPTVADLHPDHVMVYHELMISVFHAGGEIWPELGAPLPWIPDIYELGVYCNFPSAPKLRVQAPDWAFQKKLDSIAAYVSQKQIGDMVTQMRAKGPYEYLRPVEFALYDPTVYKKDFDA